LTATVRISCGALCRIPHPTENWLLLGINRSLLSKGQRVLKPIGGALAFDPAALPFTPTLENPQKTELRLSLPQTQVEVFAAWFSTRTGRETDPFRELREELVDEYGVLPQLNRSDVQMSYRNTVRTQRFSDRAGATGLLTHSFQEIFDVRFTHPALEQLLVRATPTTGLFWVTAAQIRDGTLSDDIHIQAKTLLDS
jgi:hypothetical protein